MSILLLSRFFFGRLEADANWLESDDCTCELGVLWLKTVPWAPFRSDLGWIEVAGRASNVFDESSVAFAGDLDFVSRDTSTLSKLK